MMACCGGDGRDRIENRENGSSTCTDSVAWDSMQYSRMFRLGSRCGEKIAEIRSILGEDSMVHRMAVKEPFRRVVVLSSAQIGFMARLGVTDRIVGVGEGKYIVDSTLLARVAAGEVAEVGNGPSISLEKVVALKPDLVMTFATGGSYDDYQRLKPLGIPLFVTSEWQESDPLAKLEWIKLFGMMFGVDSLATAIYEQTKADYLSSLASVGEPAEPRLSSNKGGVAGVAPAEGVADAAGGRSEGETSPLVIAGMAFGGVWYAPGGDSYTAHLIRAAGGRYLWEGDTTREMKLSLEEVVMLADSADVWVNPGAFGTAEEILVTEPRVKDFRAFREKRVCQNDGRKGPGGGNDFYESAVARPVELVGSLHDCIFGRIGSDSTAKKGAGPHSWYRNIYNF
ncbi:MAG: ABC transporter substrate-binding protein [Fibrobacter sp.]|nr:ABC transporter substrate-binding protein [Fibrobacter sp.]